VITVVGEVTELWDRVGPIVNDVVARRALLQAGTRIDPTDPQARPRPARRRRPRRAAVLRRARRRLTSPAAAYRAPSRRSSAESPRDEQSDAAEHGGSARTRTHRQRLAEHGDAAGRGNDRHADLRDGRLCHPTGGGSARYQST
jgi:hypothetical protein